MARKKINVGDWAQTGDRAFRVKETGINDATLFDGRGDAYHAKGVTVLPASPAVLAKSHRLLMRWYAVLAATVRDGVASPFERKCYDHCRRSAKGEGKK